MSALSLGRFLQGLLRYDWANGSGGGDHVKHRSVPDGGSGLTYSPAPALKETPESQMGQEHHGTLLRQEK